MWSKWIISSILISDSGYVMHYFVHNVYDANTRHWEHCWFLSHFNFLWPLGANPKVSNEGHTLRPVGSRPFNCICFGYLRTTVKPSWGVRFFGLCLLLGPPCLFVCIFICRFHSLSILGDTTLTHPGALRLTVVRWENKTLLKVPKWKYV